MKAHNLDQDQIWKNIALALGTNRTQLGIAAGVEPSIFPQMNIRAKKMGRTAYLSSESLAAIMNRFPQINANYIFGTSPDVLVQTGAGLTDTAHSPDPDALLRTIAVQARRIGELEQALAGGTGSGGSEGQG